MGEERINIESDCEFCGDKFTVEFRSDWNYHFIIGRRWCGCCDIYDNPETERMLYGTGEEPFEKEL